jgi:bla regulator protein blaR1
MPVPVPDDHFVQVAQDDVESSLTKEQKEQVASTLTATKKVMKTLQWKEIEAQIADAMTRQEKAMAQQEYKQEVERLNWENIEQNLKAQYEKVNWNKINTNLSNAMTVIKLDSIQTSYNLILTQLEKAEKEIEKANLSSCTPIPDASVEEIRKAREEVKVKVEVLKALRSNKKVIRL